MGKLIIKTNPNESYYAIVKSAKGIEKRVNLPATQAEGISLRLSFNRGKILYNILNQNTKQNDSLFLLIHSRGVVYIIKPIHSNEGQLPENILPAGINSISVIDSLGNTYCERIIFVRPLLLPQFNVNSDKNYYGKREPVSLAFNVQSSTGKPFEGDFSISITDSKNVVRDTVSDNILSYLLLSSDLKGYIENPTSYFTDNSYATREITDILMLTQGWRRFNTADCVKNKFKRQEYYLEAGQTISGKVLNLFLKPVKHCDVIMFSGYKNSISTAKTDTTGSFLIDGIEFPDSTAIFLKAKSKTKLVDVELLIDKDEFPVSKTYIPGNIAFENNPPSDYFQMIKEKYYTEGGMMVIDLEEITVKAEAKKSNDMTDFYSGMADSNMNSERIDQLSGLDLLSILSTIAGVQVSGQEVSIRGAQGNPLFLVDGIETINIEDILYLNSFDIENIAVFKGASAAIFGMRGGNGAIAITLKKGVTRQAITAPSLMHIKPLGFQKPTEFYVPKYEVDSIRKQVKPDLRTTIYWNPKLLSDSTGTINIKFYTADKPNDYNINLEGISKTGEICRFTGIIRRKE
jgi:TonB-dependent SusC/RagA subfamily outer membrane receptor